MSKVLYKLAVIWAVYFIALYISEAINYRFSKVRINPPCR